MDKKGGTFDRSDNSVSKSINRSNLDQNCLFDLDKLKEMEDEVNNLMVGEVYKNHNHNNTDYNYHHDKEYASTKKTIEIKNDYNGINDAIMHSYNNKDKYIINNLKPKQSQVSSLYDCKEKYNLLNARYNDAKKFKLEIENKNKKINQLENYITGLKFEISLLVKKNEDNLKLNLTWDSTFTEFKSKIIKLEDEKSKFKEDIEKFRNKNDDLQFKYDILIEKSKLTEENFTNLEKIYEEKENSIIQLKKQN